MPTCAITFGYVPYRDRRRQITQDVAIECLRRLPSGYTPFSIGYVNDEPPPYEDIEHLAVLTRNSADIIGNNRPLPYIKDIINTVANKPYDYIGYVNSDILLGKKWVETMQADVDAHLQCRYEIGEIDADGFLQGNMRVIGGGDKHPGVDGFFFKRLWWRQYEHLFPSDLIVGEGEWDTCYRFLLRRACQNRLESRSLYHVYHDQKWTMTSPGFRQNEDIWIKIQRQYPPRRAGETRF